MPYVDKEITCVECRTPFTFSSGEQERFAQLGFQNEPRRCPACRAARKGSGPAGRAPDRGLFPAVCADCRQPTQVPFQPKGDRPVYCSDCYRRRR